MPTSRPRAMDRADWRRKDDVPHHEAPCSTATNKSSTPPDDKLSSCWRDRTRSTATSEAAPTTQAATSSETAPTPRAATPPKTAPTTRAATSSNWRCQSDKPSSVMPPTAHDRPEGNFTIAPRPGQFIFFKNRPTGPSAFNDCFATGGLGNGQPWNHPLVVLEVQGDHILAAQVTAHSRSKSDTTAELSSASGSSSPPRSPPTPQGAWRAASPPASDSSGSSSFMDRAASPVWASRYNPIGDAQHTDDKVARLELCDSGRWNGQLARKSMANNQSPLVIEWACCEPLKKEGKTGPKDWQLAPQPRLTEVSWRLLRDLSLKGGRFVGDSSEAHERKLRTFLAKEYPHLLRKQGEYEPK